MSQDSKIRIMYIAQAAGGVDCYLKMLLKYMNKEAFENIVVFSEDYKKEDYCGLVDAYEVVKMQRAVGIQDFVAIRRIRKIIKKYQPDIVYAHSSKAGAVSRIADIGLKNQCVYNPHGWAFNMRGSKLKKKIYVLVEKMLNPFCSKIICISDAEKQSALDKKICKEEKLQVIFNGIDIENYERSEHGKVKRTDLDIPVDAFVVGMVGRISEQKSPDVFIKAAHLIKKKNKNAYFIMVGSGEMEQEIWAYAEENGLSDCLKITGWVEKPMDYIELFDVACLLSRWEGFGLVLPEYMLVGKPIVASRVDAIPNIIQDGKNGLLVEVDDFMGVSKAVLNIYHNKNLTNNLVIQELKTVHDKFDVKRVSEEHRILFKSLCPR